MAAVILPNRVVILLSNMADTTKVLLYVPQAPRCQSRIKTFYRCMVIQALTLEEVEDSTSAEQWGLSIHG